MKNKISEYIPIATAHSRNWEKNMRDENKPILVESDFYKTTAIIPVKLYKPISKIINFELS
jgi:hypothetical protein